MFTAYHDQFDLLPTEDIVRSPEVVGSQETEMLQSLNRLGKLTHQFSHTYVGKRSKWKGNSLPDVEFGLSSGSQITAEEFNHNGKTLRSSTSSNPTRAFKSRSGKYSYSLVDGGIDKRQPPHVRFFLGKRSYKHDDENSNGLSINAFHVNRVEKKNPSFSHVFGEKSDPRNVLFYPLSRKQLQTAVLNRFAVKSIRRSDEEKLHSMDQVSDRHYPVSMAGTDRRFGHNFIGRRQPNVAAVTFPGYTHAFVGKRNSQVIPYEDKLIEENKGKKNIVCKLHNYMAYNNDFDALQNLQNQIFISLVNQQLKKLPIPINDMYVAEQERHDNNLVKSNMNFDKRPEEVYEKERPTFKYQFVGKREPPSESLDTF